MSTAAKFLVEPGIVEDFVDFDRIQIVVQGGSMSNFFLHYNSSAMNEMVVVFDSNCYSNFAVALDIQIVVPMVHAVDSMKPENFTFRNIDIHLNLNIILSICFLFSGLTRIIKKKLINLITIIIHKSFKSRTLLQIFVNRKKRKKTKQID